MLLIEDSVLICFSITFWLRETAPFYTRAGYYVTRQDTKTLMVEISINDRTPSFSGYAKGDHRLLVTITHALLMRKLESLLPVSSTSRMGGA